MCGKNETVAHNQFPSRVRWSQAQRRPLAVPQRWDSSSLPLGVVSPFSHHHGHALKILAPKDKVATLLSLRALLRYGREEWRSNNSDGVEALSLRRSLECNRKSFTQLINNRAPRKSTIRPESTRVS